ncbi:calcium channel subunit Cch1 [Aspergillus luchuensis]|uniref:Calcium channel subunit Cch1 n=1 Tax=Aspergillus kawachii TaxID=1069201 RepID=A0A146F6A6_ASPKA|nr:calcium channel subunit Cch1 [Aspergillus luchuensis]
MLCLDRDILEQRTRTLYTSWRYGISSAPLRNSRMHLRGPSNILKMRKPKIVRHYADTSPPGV